MTSRKLACLALSLFLLAPPILTAKETEERDWIEARTPNFQIRSMMSEKRTIELAEYLEMFRLVVSIVTNNPPVVAPVPTEIYAVKGGRASKSFNMAANTAGFFRSGLRRNTIVVRDTVGMDETAIIMHEYVHFLVRNVNDSNYPMWFHEGFAEYLASAVIEDGIVTIGNIPEARINSFKYSNWINLRRVVSRHGGDSWGPEKSAMFYAEAWGLVHYLQNRKDQDKPFGQQLQHYVNLMDAGVDSIEAFEEAFAISMRELDKEVRKYLGGSRIPGFRFELSSLVADFKPEIRKIEREEISLALGNYALLSGEFDEAERLYLIARSDSQYEAQAEAGRGDVRKFQDQYEEALPFFERALELAPDDPYCQLDMAEYWHSRATDEEDEDVQSRFLEIAREHYETARQLDVTMPETYTMYGQTYLVDGGDFPAAVAWLEQALRLLPSSIEIRVYLAEAYLGADRKAEAAEAAKSALAWVHGESEAAEKLREVLAAAEADESVAAAH